MFSAVSGLKGHQTMLDVIGNNVANVNTVGFKSSRVVFSDLYYQTIANANAPTATAGGSNPNQIGYGSQVSSIDIINTKGGFQQTSRTLDLYISGEGYFAVLTPKGEIKFTRVGCFDFDKDGNLVDSNQNFVLDDAMNKIQIANFNEYTGIYIDTNGEIKGTNTTTKSIETIGQVGLAIIANPNGLSQEGDMYYAETANSGTIDAGTITFHKPGEATAGLLVSGGLEMSNVDLTKEFTDMIVAQRGFQANSRVITTSDDVLEEIVNLKR